MASKQRSVEEIIGNVNGGDKVGRVGGRLLTNGD